MRYHRLQITFCLTWWFRQCVGWSHSSRHAPTRPWTARNTLSDSVCHRHHSRSASACWETASYTQGHRCRQEQAHLKTRHKMHPHVHYTHIYHRDLFWLEPHVAATFAAPALDSHAQEATLDFASVHRQIPRVASKAANNVCSTCSRYNLNGSTVRQVLTAKYMYMNMRMYM